MKKIPVLNREFFKPTFWALYWSMADAVVFENNTRDVDPVSRIIFNVHQS